MTVLNLKVEGLAITGMDAAWGGADGLDDFEQKIYGGATPGAGDTGGTVSLATAAALVANAARRALADSGITPGSAHLAAFVAMNGIALAPDWGWAARVEDLGAHPNPLAVVLEKAPALLDHGFDAVVFAAASGSIALPQGAGREDTGSGFDKNTHGWLLGQGAGALVLMDSRRAASEGRRVYAVLRAAAYAPPKGTAGELPTAPALDDLRGCCKAALEAAGMTADQIGYVEAFACGVDAVDGIEIAGLVQAYRQPEQDLSTAIGSAQANAGYLGAAAGLAGVVRAALCLHHRTIPGAPSWSAPKLPALWRGAPFYVPAESRAWFNKAGVARVAAVNTIGEAGSCLHLLLAEPLAPKRDSRPNRALQQGGFALFPLAGENARDLTAGLEELRQSLLFSHDLLCEAAERYDAAQDHADAPYALAIVGHDHDEVLREIDLALAAIPNAFEKGSEWQTPMGSTFTAKPAGAKGGVALVYPGAFNSYPGVGKDLFRLFPELHARTEEVAEDIGAVMRERMLYPRGLSAFSKEDMTALEAQLLADPIAMLTSGSTMAVLYTHVISAVFGVKPQAAFGYSLGENSMLYATGVWAQGDAASNRLAESETFRARLAGPQKAVREYWGMTNGSAPSGEPLWANFLLMAAPEKVLPALENEPRVYLTHINTPRQVVIGGDPAACKRVVEAVRAPSIRAPFDYALHCAPMRSELSALAHLHDWPVEHIPDLRLYSAADYNPLPVDESEIAGRLAHMLTEPLDFPRLVKRVYDDGARVFIEAGAGGNCARWVDESLKGAEDPVLALSLNRRGSDDLSTLVRCLAKLFSHRVPVDLSALYEPKMEKVQP